MAYNASLAVVPTVCKYINESPRKQSSLLFFAYEPSLSEITLSLLWLEIYATGTCPVRLKVSLTKNNYDGTCNNASSSGG